MFELLFEAVFEPIALSGGAAGSGSGGGGIPANAVLDESGQPIQDESGSIITTED